MPEDVAAYVTGTYELPGEAVFPESIGVDPVSGDAYVGSLADGTLYQLTADGKTQVWGAGGQDGRESVAGVKVDIRGRLWVAGGYDGTLRVYDLRTREVLARMDTGARPSLVNDVAFGPDGKAYVTDSLIPALFLAHDEPPALERWADLAAAGVPWPEGLNFNGLVLTADHHHLVACQTNLGRFWRIELTSREVSEVVMDGGPLQHCDGLAISGSTLYAAVNARNLVAVADLADDGSAGRVSKLLRSDAFAFPTAVAVSGARLLVVNSQLDRMSSCPRPPFTVAVVAIPETW